MTEITDNVEATLNAIDTELFERYQVTTRAARDYAQHLADGGNPNEAYRYSGRFNLDASLADRILNAHRVANGLMANPFSLAATGKDAYEAFDILSIREGEYVKAADIIEQCSTRYRFQIESTLRKHTLCDAGWALEKGTVDGKVAYRLVRAPADAEGEGS